MTFWTRTLLDTGSAFSPSHRRLVFDLTLYVMPFVMLLASAGLVAAILRRFTKHQLSPTSGFQDAATLAPPSPDDHMRLDAELRDLD